METNRKHEGSEGPAFRNIGPLPNALAGRAAPSPPTHVRCGSLEVDRAESCVVLEGHRLRLTRREYALLLCLIDRVNRVVPRADLLETIWTLPDDYGSNVVEVYVRRLRQKLGAHARMIETIRGFGYCLRPAFTT
jgi:DNA-binding response OmpR family regulator